jgi:uncharacterized protein
MSIEYLPVGVSCNLSCEYCYQDPMRDAGNVTAPRDWSAARAQLEKENYKFTVFGGEPLLAGVKHLEEVFHFGLEKFGSNNIQTNGALITDEFIALFKKYKVSVGLSIDGPGKLNGARCDEATTALIHTNLEALCREGIIPSIIVTLSRRNALMEHWLEFYGWICYLENLGIRNVNLHILESECGREAQQLTDAENLEIFEHLYELSIGSKIRFNPFTDIRRLLLQEELEKVSCIWNACDPLTTDAVHGVTPDGTRSNCGRTNKDGINWVKGDTPGRERYILLHQTPQECGGCKGCTYFALCKGQCPGTAIDNDWRNRTVHCKVWYRLFELVEKEVLLELRLPVSRDPKALKQLEQQILSSPAGDHGDSAHGDSHGDAPHGDHHGDSDQERGEGIDVTWV